MAIPWSVIERRAIPDGVLELRRRAEDEFLICLDGRILMNSRNSASERALAERSCAVLAGRTDPRVLIGGLGMGITLCAALAALPERARVTVAELNPVIVEWCRGPLAGVNAACLDDPRVTVVLEDVARTIAASRGLDAILLDLYEGPHGPTPRKDPFYGSQAIHRTRAALAPGGAFAIWAEDPDPAFEARLRKARFEVTRFRPGRGGRRHAVILGRRTDPAGSDQAP